MKRKIEAVLCLGMSALSVSALVVGCGGGSGGVVTPTPTAQPTSRPVPTPTTAPNQAVSGTVNVTFSQVRDTRVVDVPFNQGDFFGRLTNAGLNGRLLLNVYGSNPDTRLGRVLVVDVSRVGSLRAGQSFNLALPASASPSFNGVVLSQQIGTGEELIYRSLSGRVVIEALRGRDATVRLEQVVLSLLRGSATPEARNAFVLNGRVTVRNLDLTQQ